MPQQAVAYVLLEEISSLLKVVIFKGGLKQQNDYFKILIMRMLKSVFIHLTHNNTSHNIIRPSSIYVYLSECVHIITKQN